MKHKTFALTALIIISLVSTTTASAQTRGWGYNFEGQLGIGNTMSQPTPLTISAVPDATGIGGGSLHTLFLKGDGTLVAAGSNERGQLGDGTTTTRSTPVAVTGLTNVIQATGGGEHSAALLADGMVWSWGRNQYGQSGNGTMTIPGCQCVTLPTLSFITGVAQIDAGYYHTLAVKDDGTVWGWGRNDKGQLGDNSPTTRSTPVQVGVGVAGFSNIVAVSAGEEHSIALKSDGTVWVWGNNFDGQIGNGSTSPEAQFFPVQNSTLTNVAAISAGESHNLALLRDGTIRVWGNNSRGQTGNGAETSPQLTPVQTSGITNVVEIEAVGNTNVVRLRDGSVSAWGSNFYGQIGNGTTSANSCVCQPSPVTTSVGTGNAAIGNGYRHNFALKPVISLTSGTGKVVRGDNLFVTFSNVTGAGDFAYTAIDPTTTGLIVPMDYTIQANQPAYDLTKTAATSGDIQVCIQVNEPNPANYPTLKILHEEGINLVDVTTSFSSVFGNVCGKVTSFSRFVIAQGLTATAANASISGRVSAADGSGIGKARISLTLRNGEVRAVTTSPFGYYRFENLEVGQTYVLSIAAKRYTFNNPTRVVSLNEDLTGEDFTVVGGNRRLK